MTKRTYQGGSIVAYVIISVLLVSALIGGVYLVRWRGDQIAQQKSATESKKDKSDELKKQKETNQPVSISTPDPEVEVNKEVASSDIDTESDQKDDQTMPVTGFEFSPVSYIGIFFITVLVSSFIKSRDINRSRL